MQIKEKVPSALLKRRARKGIPEGIRGSAWATLTEAKSMVPHGLSCNSWVEQLLLKPLSKEDRNGIYKDITRTLPD